MASTTFLNLQGPNGPVKGGSTDSQFPSLIEIDAFSFTGPSFTGDKTRAVIGGQAPPPGAFAFTVVKRFDLSSPELLQLFSKHQSAQPQPFATAVLSVRPFGGCLILVLTFSDLYLLEYQFLPLYRDSNYPLEKLAFSFRTVQLQYTPLDPKSSQPLSPLTAGWNLKTMQML